MDLNLPVIYYFNENRKEMVNGESIETCYEHKVITNLTIESSRIEGVGRAGGTSASFTEWARMKYAKVFLKSGTTIDVHYSYEQMLKIWDDSKKVDKSTQEN